MADNVLERITFNTGDTVFSEGEKGYRAFIIQEGEIEIVKNKDGTEIVLATIGKGGIFGEMALIDDSPRMATARAATNGVVIVVTTEMFNAKLEKTDPFIRGLLRILSDHSRRISKENVSLKTKLDALSPEPEEKSD